MSETESPINQPHVDDADALDFFGDEAAGHLTLDPSDATPPPEAEQPVLPEAESVEGLAEGAAATVEGVGVDGSIEQTIGDVAEAGEPVVEPVVEAAATAPEVRSGTTERPYVILQELVLTKEQLEAMLAELAQGQDPRTALFEIERLGARNHKHAFAQTWENQEYGPSARLAAVTERAMVLKTIKPRVITTNALEIS